MLKIRRPLGRLIFNMGIAIPGKTVFLIETAPSWFSLYPSQKQRGRQGDCLGRHWERWSLSSTSPVTAGTVILTTVSVQCSKVSPVALGQLATFANEATSKNISLHGQVHHTDSLKHWNGNVVILINFHHWLLWKLSFWQLPVQPVMKISSKMTFSFQWDKW